MCTLLCSGCAPRLSVQSTYDPEANFRFYQTFSWYTAEIPAPRQGSGSTLYSTLLDQRIKEAIASEMVKKGIKPTTDNPGLLVAYDIAIEAPQEVASAITDLAPGFGYGYGYWYGYRYRYNGAGIQNFNSINAYTSGSLLIDLIDQNTNQVVWRGTLSAEIDPVTIDVEKINRAVATIMAQFPPVPRNVR
ncbi:DUF4136 domain-containing protein [Pontibacter sp. H249]|uniref:DUF4136 domain-containing protein n=1 Tax=Pontibacter sp. H249 TaxID=3133420 RepID=UPI0030C2D75A